MKLIKWLFGILVVAMLAMVIYVTALFDPNDFKGQIIKEVKQQTGRELVIAQDMSWRFFPNLGIKFGEISLSNPNGFHPTALVSIESAMADVALLPLLEKRVEIVQLNLDGLTVNLVTRKDGSGSLDGLVSQSPAKSGQQDEAGGAPQLAGLQIGGLKINNTRVNLIDESLGETQSVTLENLHLGRFVLGEAADISYRFKATLTEMQVESEGLGWLTVGKAFKRIELNGLSVQTRLSGEKIPSKEMQLNLLSDIGIDTAVSKLSMQLHEVTAGNIKATGELQLQYANKVPKLVAKLALGDIELDALLPAESTAPQANNKSETEDEPDLSGLKAVDMTLSLSAKSIKVANLLTQDWLMDLSVNNGVLTLSRLTAELYQGKLLAKARIDARQSVATYSFEKEITGVKLLPLLKDGAELALLSGSANVTVSGQGQSLIPDNIKQNLKAKGQFSVMDGALYGVNIPQTIRSAQAKLKGDLQAADQKELKTDFSSLTGSFTMDEGIVNNPDLAMASPLLRVGGAGTANMLTQALDYKLTTTLVGSLKGQGVETDALAGVDIPFAISGSLQDPQFALDTQALFDAKLKQEADKAKDKLKESILKKLGGF
jgi:AsmA protein